MAEGRLTTGEFDERMTSALQARTLADVAPLFEDLPAPHPARVVSTGAPLLPTPLGAPVGSTGRELARSEGKWDLSPQAIMGTVMGVSWGLAIILFLTTELGWWLFLIPALLLPAFGNLLRNPDKNKEIPSGDKKRKS